MLLNAFILLTVLLLALRVSIELKFSSDAIS